MQDQIKPASRIKNCVADIGYDLGHVDLPMEGVTGWNPDPNDPEYYEAFGVWEVDLVGHGTHVDGTIGAIRDNDGELSIDLRSYELKSINHAHVHSYLADISSLSEGVVGVNAGPTRFSFHIAKALNDEGWGTGKKSA